MWNYSGFGERGTPRTGIPERRGEGTETHTKKEAT
jgi:hypothetical protein